MPTENSTLPEKQIQEYKYFFKKYLLNIKDRTKALQDTSTALNTLNANPIHGFMEPALEHNVKVAVKVESALTKHYPTEFINLYKKTVEKQPSKKFDKADKIAEKNILLGMLAVFGAGLEEMNEQAKNQHNYQKNILSFTYNCLYHHGLHPNIFSREEKKNKRFNLLIKHKTHSRAILEDFKVLIPWDAFHNDYLSYYKNKKPIKMGGKLIPFEKIVELKITTSLLADDEVELFGRKNNILTSGREKNQLNFLNICKDETERFHPNPFEADVKAKESHRYQETKIALIEFPDALKLFNSAIQKINSASTYRNCLDDLRLCLELLLRSKLKNAKSLENQTQALGKYLKDKGGSSEINNLFHKLMEFYTTYQNNYVKHNDAIKPNEVKLVVNLSSELIVHVATL